MPLDRTATATTTAQINADDYDSRSARKGGNPLQRGSACLSCRKRKMKCDATKPVCRQCVKANRAEECDYDDGRQKSRTQILQEKISKLEDRIRELEGAEDSDMPECDEGLGEHAYDAAYVQSGGEHAGLGLGLGYGLPGDSGFGAYHSPNESASGSGASSNSQSFSPLIIDAGAGASASTSLGYSGSSSMPMLVQPPQQLHQNASAFYPPSDMSAFGFPTSTSPDGSARSPSADPSGSGSYGHGWMAQQQQHQDQIMSSILGSTSGTEYNMGMESGMGFDPSMALSMDMDMGNVGSGNIGFSMGIPSDTSMSMSMAAYASQDFSGFTGSSTSYANTTNPGAAMFVHPGTPPSVIQPASSSTPYSSPPVLISGSATTGSIPGPGPNSFSAPRTNTGTNGRSATQVQGGLNASKSGKPMSRWDADVLHVQERKILVDIFLPHARQCGLDLSPERLYQRLELDDSYPSLFPSPQNKAQADARPPPAHAALANAIYLLACHFSAVHIPGSGPSAQQVTGSRNNNGKQTDLSSHEPHFLTRALRGIAAALEAGEAAATDSASSRSNRSSRSSRAGSASARSSVAGSPASAFHSRPGTSQGGAVSALPTTTTTTTAATITTGLGGGVGKDKDEVLDAATPLVDAVQASALLAVYFFAKARLLEGYYHASAAARLAVSLGMHQVRSAVWKPLVPTSPPSSSAPSSSFGSTTFDSPPHGGSSFNVSNSSDASSSSSSGSWSGSPTPSPAVLLPPARSALEHAERVGAFWSVFFVDRCWSVATGLPSSLPDDEHPQLKISTVWPWDVHEGGVEITRDNADYESLGSLFDVNTIQAGGGSAMKNRSTKALKAKAAAFFERAARIASMQSESNHWEQLTQLEFALNNFISNLPPYVISSPPTPQSLPPSSSPASVQQSVDIELALVHTLAHAAVIQLHHPRAQKDVQAHAVCVRAAATCCQIARRLGPADYMLMDPVVGTCWMCVSDVLLRERMWGGDMRAAAAAGGVAVRAAGEEMGGGESYYGVEAELDAVVGGLRQLSYVFPVALYQVQKVEQSRNAPSF